MSDILTPQGLEDAETLKDDNLMEVYQDPSGGVRNNKRARLDVLRDFFKKLPTYTANNLVQADGTGTLRTTNLSTTEVSDTVTRSQNNESAIIVLDQRVDGNDADITNNSNRITSNDNDISTLDGRITSNDNDISTLNGRVDDNDTDITTLDGRITSNDTDIATLDGRVDGHDTDISTLDGRITSNDTDITNLQNKTPQSYKITDEVKFLSVDTGYGKNDVLPKPIIFDSDSNPILPNISDGQSGMKSISQGFGSSNVVLPSLGTYSYIYTHFNSSTLTVNQESKALANGGDTVLTLGSDDNVSITYIRLS